MNQMESKYFYSKLECCSDHHPMMCVILQQCQVVAIWLILYSHQVKISVEFYLYPTVGTVLIHSIKPELTE